MRVLIIEDDSDIHALLEELLVDAGYETLSAFSGTEGLLQLKHETVDLILLDLMLPGKSGEVLLQEIRQTSQVPIIVLTAKEEKGLNVKLLRAGADDFISKPFQVDEVLARVEVQMRRLKNSHQSLNQVLVHKEIKINDETKEVFVNGDLIILTAREYNILKLFIEHPSKVFSKANIFESVWGDEYMGDDNTITVHISQIRKKLVQANASDEYIKTIWGIGYKFDAS